MKTRFLLPILFLTSTLAPLHAAEPAAAAPAAPATGDDLSAYKTADDLWKHLQELQQQQPAEKPTSREQALAMARSHLQAVAAAATAFNATYATDTRHWAAKMIALRADMQTRRLSGEPTDTDAERAKLDEIIKAADAPEPLKAEAAFTRALTYSSDFKTKPASYVTFNEAATAFMTQYAAHPLASQMQILQLRVLAEDPTPQGAELLKKLTDSKDSKIAEIAKTLIAKREALVELKSKPVELEFTSSDGQTADLAMMRGKVVLVDFWASGNEPSMAEMPNIVATYGKLHSKGFEVLGISLDEDKAKMQEAIKANAMPWLQYFDGLGLKNKISTRYGIDSLPASFLIDKKGMLRETGLRGPALEEAVTRLLKE